MQSFERIHRSNLVNTGVLPLQFEPGVTRHTLGITGDSRLNIDIPNHMEPLSGVNGRIHTKGKVNGGMCSVQYFPQSKCLTL